MKYKIRATMVAVFVISAFSGTCTAQSEIFSEEVDALFDQWTEPDRPGGVVGIFRYGDLIHSAAYGLANLENSTPNTLNTVFNIASLSKTFTAFAVLLLEQQELLSLDDDIRTYLPELPDFGEKISIYHLLHHTSGLRNFNTLLALAGISEDVAMDRNALFRVITNQVELNHTPGDQAIYSNTNFFLLALLVEKVSGQSFQQFTNDRIFQPLGMTDTFFSEGIIPGEATLALGYATTDGSNFIRDMPQHHAVGATGLMTTLNDFARWEANFWDPVVGSAELISKLYAKGLLNTGYEVAYAKGTGNTTYRGLQLHGMSGGEPGYRSNHLQFPDSGLSIVLMANATYDVGTPGINIATLYLEQEFMAAERALENHRNKFIALPDEVLLKHSGAYQHTDTSDIIYAYPNTQDSSIFISGAGLGMRTLPTSATRFESITPGDSTRIEFAVDSITAPDIVVSQNNHAVFTGTALLEAEITPDYLRQFVGNYYSQEVESGFDIVLENGNLYRTREGTPNRLLTSQYVNLFETEGGLGSMLFEQNTDGQITGFRISIAGVNNLLFSKR